MNLSDPSQTPRRRVVVAGANSPTGRLLLLLLRDSGIHATALVRQPTRLVADDIIADWVNDPRSDAAIAAADAVVLLTGVFGATDWRTYKDGMVGTAERIARAVGERNTRVVYFSSLLADAGADADNWYLKAKGLAEQALAPLANHVIFRLGPVVRGSPQPLPFEQALLQPAPDAPVMLYGDVDRMSRPINLGDVATIAETAALGTGEPGIYELAGPEEHSLADLARLANGGEVPIQSLPAETGSSLHHGQMMSSQTVRDLLAHIASPRDAQATFATAQTFGLRLTPLSLAWPLDAVEA